MSMRNLFLALVLANLGFAAWSSWFAPEPSPGRRMDDALPGITLVSEVPADLRTSGVIVETATAVPPAEALPGEPTSAPPAPSVESEPDPSPPAATEPADPVPVLAGETCTSVGPFRELSQAASAAATLREAGHQPTQRVAEGDIWIGYWVYIPALPTDEEAEEVLEKVRADGMSDAYIIPNSDSGNLVSLGVFSEISGVSRRRDQVRALGFEPQVVDRTRRATVYWVDVTLAAGQTLDFDALQPPGRIIRLEQRSCEAPVN
jgi:cell division septation protein DedD